MIFGHCFQGTRKLLVKQDGWTSFGNMIGVCLRENIAQVFSRTRAVLRLPTAARKTWNPSSPATSQLGVFTFFCSQGQTINQGTYLPYVTPILGKEPRE